MRARDAHVVYDYKSPRQPFWVGIDEQMLLRCLHCGDKCIIALPLPVTVATAAMKAYGRLHRRCPWRAERGIRAQRDRTLAYGLAHGALDWRERA